MQYLIRFLTLPLQVMVVILIGSWIHTMFPYASVLWIVGVLQVVSILVLTLGSVNITLPEFIKMLRGQSNAQK
ncbi:MAG: hypothetical protein NTX72_04285 [Candidatus Uhrbacteria bacterium]|nr:hypothetical protein [Candidatus Uhrbacteria bacterium]